MRTLRRSIALLSLAARKILSVLSCPLQPKPLAKAPMHLPSTLKGRVVVITGSTRGIGLALAHAFALHGARLVMHGRHAADLASARRSVEATGARIEADATSSRRSSPGTPGRVRRQWEPGKTPCSSALEAALRRR